MKIDYHIHSQFSADSSLNMDVVIGKAVRRRYAEIAFTDHFDFLVSEIKEWGLPSYKDYSKAIADAKSRLHGLQILKGVELGEYHRCFEMADEVIGSDPPDFKIGAIHVLSSGENISVPLKIKVTPELIASYYRDNLELVKHGNFDILAHLGVYKRYLVNKPDESVADDIIKEIFSIIIDKKIALEVNLSGMSRTLRDILPDEKHLLLYKKMGGELLTIGSDAHTQESFDNNYDVAIRRLNGLGFSHFARMREGEWEQFRVVC